MKLDRYTVLGNPVSHSKSPWIHARFAQLTGQTLEYTATEPPAGGFVHCLHELRANGLLGCNVTAPFKQEAAAFALAHGQVSGAVALAGAANTLHWSTSGKVFADNTDGEGLVRDIEEHAQFPLAGKVVALLGAGGAAAGVLAPLMRCGPKAIWVFNRNLERAQALVARHQAWSEAENLLQKTQLLSQDLRSFSGFFHFKDAPQLRFDVLINATASSLGGNVLRPGPGWWQEGQQLLAYDMAYGAAAVPFLTACEGCAPGRLEARDGLGMLVAQAAKAFEIWRGVMPPSQEVLAELREHMGGRS